MQSNITFDSKFIFVCISFSPCVVCFALLSKCTMPLLSWDARITRRHKTEKKLVHICRNICRNPWHAGDDDDDERE